MLNHTLNINRKTMKINKITPDKMLHFTCGEVIGLFIFFLAYGFLEDVLFTQCFVGSIFAIVGGFIAGMAKEIYDGKHGGSVEGKDFVSTVLGSLAGAILGVIALLASYLY